MNLTRSLKTLILDRFKTGSTIAEIAAWYNHKPEKIEAVIRAGMIDQDIDRLRANAHHVTQNGQDCPKLMVEGDDSASATDKFEGEPHTLVRFK